MTEVRRSACVILTPRMLPAAGSSRCLRRTPPAALRPVRPGPARRRAHSPAAAVAVAAVRAPPAPRVPPGLRVPPGRPAPQDRPERYRRPVRYQILPRLTARRRRRLPRPSTLCLTLCVPQDFSPPDSGSMTNRPRLSLLGERRGLSDQNRRQTAGKRTRMDCVLRQQGLPCSASAKSKLRIRSYSSSVILRIVPCLKPYGNENSASARRKFASRRLSATKGT